MFALGVLYPATCGNASSFDAPCYCHAARCIDHFLLRNGTCIMGNHGGYLLVLTYVCVVPELTMSTHVQLPAQGVIADQIHQWKCLGYTFLIPQTRCMQHSTFSGGSGATVCTLDRWKESSTSNCELDHSASTWEIQHSHQIVKPERCVSIQTFDGSMLGMLLSISAVLVIAYRIRTTETSTPMNRFITSPPLI